MSKDKPVANVKPHCSLYGVSLETLREIISGKSETCRKLNWVGEGEGGAQVDPKDAPKITSVTCTSIKPFFTRDYCSSGCIYH